MISAHFGTLSRWQYSHNITNTSQSGPMGVFAVHIINPDDTAEINYIHKDHTSTSLSTGLGSWNTITDESGKLLQELSFDACSVKPDFCESSEAKTLVELISAEARGREGNRRDPDTWRAFAGTPPEPLFDRGFTGHEHLYAVNLINMNGRVYDPIVSRMLSPDNFIQAPGYSQSLNRYSYCWNNPLKYTDPSGQELGVENRNNWFWWEYRGGSNSSHSIGPGSGNHWSDPYRDKDGDFMLMTSRVFDNKHGHGAWDNYFKKWNKHAGFEVNRKYTDNGVEISYSGKWVSHSTSYYGAESEEDDQTGGGDPVQTVNNASNYAGIVVSAVQQTMQNTKVGSDVAYYLSGNMKVLNTINNAFKYAPYVGLGTTILTGAYLSTEINPKTGQPYQSWAETGTDIGVNFATIYMEAQYGGWYGAGAAIFYLGVKKNVQYQIKNELNPGMIFIMNKE